MGNASALIQPTNANELAHKPRNYTSFPGSSYLLPSDEVEKDRLLYQHNLWKRMFEGRIVIAPVSLRPEDRVLECATGSGVWLLDFARSAHPSISMYGIDIEPNLFPTGYSSNVNFSVASVTSLPTEWSNMFSFVQQRLLVAALRRSQWSVALEEIYRVIAPGGWVQLSEPGMRQAGPITERLVAILEALYASRDLVGDIPRLLPSMLADVGFINVRCELRHVPLGKWAGRDGEDGKEHSAQFLRAIKNSVLIAGGFGMVHSEQDFDNLAGDVVKEFDETLGASMPWYIIYGQKPIS